MIESENIFNQGEAIVRRSPLPSISLAMRSDRLDRGAEPPGIGQILADEGYKERANVAKDSEALGVNLWKLEHVAKATFPMISGDYDSAISNCQRVLDGLDKAMQRPAEFGANQVHPAYLELHNIVVGYLKQTKSNLDDTSAALHSAVMLYAETDRISAAELLRRVKLDPDLKG